MKTAAAPASPHRGPSVSDLEFVTLADLAGVWRREILYEPRETVADSTARDGSIVLWAQTPQGPFVDVRYVRHEGFRVRGFAGRTVLSFPSLADPAADPTAFRITWQRHTDTWPESCPSGVDSATCRIIGSLTGAGAQPLLMEEGDGYLEVWRRVVPWNSETDRHFAQHAVRSALSQQSTDAAGLPIYERIQIQLPASDDEPNRSSGDATFTSTPTSVAVIGLGVKLDSAISIAPESCR